MLRAVGRGIVGVFSSYGTVCLILLLLMVLTYCGTLEQQHLNIYDVQAKYFESVFVMAKLGPISIPLPGAYILLLLLFVALIVGGMVRMRWTASRIGILVTHFGMALLLLGGFVEYQYSVKGTLGLLEAEDYRDTNQNGVFDPGEPYLDANSDGKWTPGESASHFYSYFLKDFVLVRHNEDRSVREFMVPAEQLGKAEDAPVTFVHDELPFDIEISGYSRNSHPIRVEPGAGYGVRGYSLRRLPPDPEQAEAHEPGFFVTLRPKSQRGRSVREIVWGAQRYPKRVALDGALWDLDVRRRAYPMPFRVQLHDAVHRRHPGTSRPMEYSSHVSKIENDLAVRRHITMNEPLRHKGFTLYQSSYKDRPGGPDTSIFAVVKNPADRVPEIACYVIALGLLVHFFLKLIGHIERQSRRRGKVSGHSPSTPAVEGAA